MDLKRLRHIVALAERRNFARAAEAVHLTQPALTRSIQAAEDEFGLRLFDRGPNDVRPTPAGAFLIERARRLVYEGRSLERDMALLKGGEIGEAAFGCGPFPAATLLPQLLAELRSAYPGVGMRVVTGSADWLSKHLLEEQIEFFVADTRDLPPNPDLVTRPLIQIEAGFFVRAGHPLAGVGRADLGAVWRFGVASVRVPQNLGIVIGRALGLPEGAPPPLAVECDTVSTLKEIALGSDTVLAAPLSCVASELKSGALHQVGVMHAPPLVSHTGIVTLRARSLSPIAERILQRLDEQVRALT